MRLALAIGFLPLALTGCAGNPVTEFTAAQAGAASEIEVIWLNLVHDVNFDVGEAQLSDAEEHLLDAFLADLNVGPVDDVIIDPGSFRGGIVEPRIDAVTDFLNDRLPGNRIAIRHLGWAESDEDFKVTVGRYMVIPPNCPNYMSNSTFNPRNLASSNFGCATAVNLALMVADPGDLLQGRAPSPADGATMASAVARYRAGEITELQFTQSLGNGR